MLKENLDAKSMYNLELHEEFEINEACYAMRVIGGWLYKFYTRHEDEHGNEFYRIASSTFVPFNNEMMPV
jgi:hypothetical protein